MVVLVNLSLGSRASTRGSGCSAVAEGKSWPCKACKGGEVPQQAAGTGLNMHQARQGKLDVAMEWAVVQPGSTRLCQTKAASAQQPASKATRAARSSTVHHAATAPPHHHKHTHLRHLKVEGIDGLHAILLLQVSRHPAGHEDHVQLHGSSKGKALALCGRARLRTPPAPVLSLLPLTITCGGGCRSHVPRTPRSSQTCTPQHTTWMRGPAGEAGAASSTCSALATWGLQRRPGWLLKHSPR